MACRDWENETPADRAYDECRRGYEKQITELKTRNDEFAAMLCSVCGYIEDYEYELFKNIDPKVSVWWEKHKEQDRQQQELALKLAQMKEQQKLQEEVQEIVAKRAKAKLTQAELDALMQVMRYGG